MKHLLSTITVLFVLLTSNVSWGEVNKKGLICQCQKCSVYKLERGFWFQDGKVEPRFFTETQDLFVTTPGKVSSFGTTLDRIEWYYGPFRYQLDRETLNLKSFSGGGLETEGFCEVFDKSGFEKTWKKMRDEHQISLNKKLKKNKI